MEQELYIIKRVNWEYNDSVGDYLTENENFSRNLKEVKVFDNFNDVYKYKVALIQKDRDNEFMYQVIAM